MFMPMSVKGREGLGARAAAWASCDYNGNKMCSLAEVDGWIQKLLQQEFAEGDEVSKQVEGLRLSAVQAHYHGPTSACSTCSSGSATAPATSVPSTTPTTSPPQAFQHCQQPRTQRIVSSQKVQKYCSGAA